MEENLKKEFYQALLHKKKEYEGRFYVGVKTTGIFCRPTCPARKPAYENCEFFESVQEVLFASYRPCKRCRPLDYPKESSPLVEQCLELIERDPEKRWQSEDLRKLSLDPSTVRRQFHKRFGMTFIEYARAKRMGIALKSIRAGGAVIDAQLDAGYDSSSGFRDAFSKIMGIPPSHSGQYGVLKSSWIDTPLGPMIAIADEESLYLLEFVDRRGLELEIDHLRKRTRSAIIPGETDPICSITHELEAYFNHRSSSFNTPLKLLGSPFQKEVWEALMEIPYGETTTYQELAESLGIPKALRAVGRANGANQLAIIVPCHRVIGTDGSLTGYGGGLYRKRQLLNLEKGIG